jgi:hypothetical protein
MALGVFVGSSATDMPLEPLAWSAAVGLAAASKCKALRLAKAGVHWRLLGETSCAG